MSHFVMRLAVLSLLVAVLAAVGVAATAAAPVSAPDAPAVPLQPTEEPREGPIPCDPVWDRTIEPRIVEEGGRVTVKSTYYFKCSGETRKINYFILLENSNALRQGRGGMVALDNFEDGARDFVNQVDYANGSQGGLMLYASVNQIRVPLGGGEQNRKNMLEALGNISIKPIDNANGAGAAIRDATGLLPTQEDDPDATNVLIIIDAGAEEVPGEGPPIINRATACNAARQSGVLVVGIGFPASGNRLLTCATRGWYWRTNTNEATDLPDIFDEITEAILRGREMKQVNYSDWPHPGVNYVDGSGYPRDYDYEVIGEYTWEFPGKQAPPTGQQIEYAFDLDRVTFPGNQITEVSIDSTLSFNFTAGDPIPILMPNPEVCIYRPGYQQFCDDWAARYLTPTAPPETPSATITPGGATETPTATPTSTIDPSGSGTPTPTETTEPTPTATEAPTQNTGGSELYVPAAYNK
ncbi:MAG: hypothetical protein ACK2UL_03655 [Anaerolineae bacterium]|jgi:hypothetical protein